MVNKEVAPVDQLRAIVGSGSDHFVGSEGFRYPPSCDEVVSCSLMIMLTSVSATATVSLDRCADGCIVIFISMSSLVSLSLVQRTVS